jgi:predicted nucleotidyltransferase
MEAVVPYEQRLKRDFASALREGSMYFEEGGAVQQTLRQITKRLDEIGVTYAVVGGLALFFHGYRRFTADVDILVTKDDLKTIHERLEGLGYLPPFEKSKHLRDTTTGVKVEFLTTGEYPGDGKPKPVAFPNPADVRIAAAGMWFISLPALVELKLASGISNPLRGKDIVDVQELISELKLDESLAPRLNAYVRDKFLELVKLVRDNPKPDE